MVATNTLISIAEEHGLDLKFVTRWNPPEGDDLRPLIAMPNLPRPTHGEGMQPRTIFGTAAWNKTRKRCYRAANDTCEICGDKPDNTRFRHSHEVFAIDYEKGTSTFIRCFCVCAQCHLSCIHNGRALTLYSKGVSYMTAEKLLTGAEKAFSIVRDYNKDHPGSDIRLYSTYIEYLKHMELRVPLLNLIKQYGVKFYMEDPKKTAKWKDWRVVINEKEYHTPYKNEKEWEKAMEQRNYNDTLNKDGLKIKELSAKEVAEEHNKLKGF